MTKMNVLEKHGFSGLSRWPSIEQLKVDDAIDHYFMHGYEPKDKIITKNTSVTAFGSCFAGNVSRYLQAAGYTVNAHNWDHNASDFIRIDEIMVHTPALLAQFQWAFNDKPLDNIFIGGAEEKAKTYHDIDHCKELIKKTDFFIITLGLTEAWYDKKNENYLWKFVPNKKLDPQRFENNFISFQDNLKNINEIYSLIRKNIPNAHILFTLSPIPLLGSYHGKSVVCANVASKSTLKAALHEFFSFTNDDNLHYFPSYEMVNHFFHFPWQDDFRHITPETIEIIMKTFDRYYLKGI